MDNVDSDFSKKKFYSLRWDIFRFVTKFSLKKKQIWTTKFEEGNLASKLFELVTKNYLEKWQNKREMIRSKGEMSRAKIFFKTTFHLNRNWNLIIFLIWYFAIFHLIEWFAILKTEKKSGNIWHPHTPSNFVAGWYR